MEEILKRELYKFVQVHPQVAFRYEFSRRRNRYLVSYEFANMESDDSPLWDDIFVLESSFDQYNDAPLFSEGDRLFTLSASAENVTFRTHGSEEKVEYSECEVCFVNSSHRSVSYNGEFTEDFLGNIPTYSFAS